MRPPEMCTFPLHFAFHIRFSLRLTVRLSLASGNSSNDVRWRCRTVLENYRGLVELSPMLRIVIVAARLTLHGQPSSLCNKENLQQNWLEGVAFVSCVLSPSLFLFLADQPRRLQSYRWWSIIIRWATTASHTQPSWRVTGSNRVALHVIEFTLIRRPALSSKLSHREPLSLCFGINLVLLTMLAEPMFTCNLLSRCWLLISFKYHFWIPNSLFPSRKCCWFGRPSTLPCHSMYLASDSSYFKQLRSVYFFLL